MQGLEMALAAARIAEARQGKGIMVMDLSDLTVVTDYFVLVTGRSPTHVRALVDRITDGLAREGARLLHREGYERGRWVLLDYGGVVIHVLCEEEREFYALERLWGDAPVVWAAGAASSELVGSGS